MNTNRQSGRLARAGFTLIELLVVMVVIAVLAALTLRLYSSAQERARYNRCKTEIWQLEAACEEYRRDNGRYPPGGTPGSDPRPQSLLLLVSGPKTYLDWPRDRIVPNGLLDPWGTVYRYMLYDSSPPDVYRPQTEVAKPLIASDSGGIANRFGLGYTGIYRP